MFKTGNRCGASWLAPLTGLLVVSCMGGEQGQAPLTAELPLHLEEHLDAATVEGFEVATDAPIAVEWRFDQEHPDWKATSPLNPETEPATARRNDDALQLVLTEVNRVAGAPGNRTGLSGGIYVDLPDWKREDWSHVMVRARSTGEVNNLTAGFNVREALGPGVHERGPFQFVGETVHLIDDGNAHSYLMRADWSWGEWKGPWRQLGFELSAEGPATLDILSVSVIPAAADYAGATVGVRTQARRGIYRRSLYTHAPGTLEYTVRVPEQGRLDVNLGVVRDDIPVTVRITASACST